MSGKAFLAALILGGEVGGRIESASVVVEAKRGFHNPAVQGPFSAAAAVGKLLGLNEDTLVNAQASLAPARPDSRPTQGARGIQDG